MHGELNSYFGEGIKMRGVLKYKGTLRMDGKFQGEIHADDTLIVGTSGDLDAKISIGSLFNMGKIKGDIRATKQISLFAGSLLDGNIDTPNLISEDGALFHGSCKMPSTPQKSKAPAKESALKGALARNYLQTPAGRIETTGKPIRTKAANQGHKPKKSMALAAAILITLLASGGAIAYLASGWKNSIGSYPLSRFVYERFAQDEPQKLAPLADTYFSEEKYADAVRVYLRLKELSPKNFGEVARLAASLEKEGRVKEAVSHLEEGLYNGGYDARVVERLRRRYTKENEDVSLIRLQEFVVSNNPDGLEETARLFTLYQNSRRHEEALKIYMGKLASSPMTAVDLRTVGRLQKSLGNMDESIKNLSRLVALNPRDIEGHLELAYAYHKTGLEAKAVQEFYVVSRIDPKQVESVNNKGFASLARGNTSKAIEFFNLALTQDQNNLRSFLGLATTYSKLGNGEKAELYCEKILKIDPDYSPALNRLAWVYAKDKRNLDKAERYSIASMKYQKDLPDYLDTLSEVYYQKKEYTKAVKNMQRALDARPNNKYFQSHMKKFMAALKRSDPAFYKEMTKMDVELQAKEEARQRAVAVRRAEEEAKREAAIKARIKLEEEKIRRAATEKAAQEAESRQTPVDETGENPDQTGAEDLTQMIELQRAGQRAE